MNKELNLMIYPNPSNSETNLKLSQKNKKTEIRIMNQSGRLIYNETVFDTDSLIINTNYWPSGIYFIQALDNFNSYFGKFVVIK
jgi:hypothetical protein